MSRANSQLADENSELRRQVAALESVIDGFRETTAPTSGTPAREVEGKYRELVERLDLAFQVITPAIWDWDVEKKWNWGSSGLQLLFGRGDEEATEKFDIWDDDDLWTSHIHPDDCAQVKRCLRNHLEIDTPYDVEYRYYLPDGEYIWVHSVGRTVRAVDGRPLRMVGLCINITTRKLAELELQRLREAVDDAAEGLVLFDSNERLVYANKRYREIYSEVAHLLTVGESRINIGRAYCASGAIPEAIGQVDEFLKTFWEGRDSSDTFEQQLANGSWIKHSHRVLPGGGIVSIRTDITDIKKREQTLRESEERFRALFENAGVGIAMSDDQGRIQNANPALQNMLGFTGGEINALTIADITHPDDLMESQKRRNAMIAGAASAYGMDKRFIRKDGQTVWCHVASTPVLDCNGDFRFSVAVLENITERKLMEEQFRQVQKMEAMGQLTGGVAHDFNNLLAVMLGNLELIRDSVSADKGVGEMIERGIKATERGAALTDRLLAFSRKQTLLPTALDLNQLVLSMADLLRRTLGETIEIKSIEAAGLWLCHADQSQLENALLNLSINARDAMPEGGTLTIETANLVLDDDFAGAQADAEPGDYIMLGVSDSGSGISSEALKHVFEPFFTTKEVGKGTGLGLSMVYGFAKQSGGNVTIYSAPGKGTSVKLYLPRSLGQIDKPNLNEARSDIPSAQGEVILIVEDDADLRTLAVALLSGLGYEIAEAASAEAALQVLECSTPINLLLSDVILPGGMNGPGLAAEVRRRSPATKIVFMTGYAKEAFAKQHGLDKPTHVLQKPFRKADLANKIRSVLDEE